MAHGQLVQPRCRDFIFAVIGSGNLSTNRGGSIHIITEVGGAQNGIAKVVGVKKAPQRGFQAFDNKTRFANLVDALVAVHAAGQIASKGA